MCMTSQLGYAARYDRRLLCCGKALIRFQISPQAVPSIIGATENRRFTDFGAFCMPANILPAISGRSIGNHFSSSPARFLAFSSLKYDIRYDIEQRA